MNNWREELIETIALQISRAQFGDWVINPTEKTREQARAALAVAEPVIREQCAKKCEGDFDSEMKGYGAYFAAAIRDSRNCVPEGGKVENQTKLD